LERRLAAILAADVVGYSKLMTENEEATLSQLKAHRAVVFDPRIADHNGRIIKLIGDGTLVEFASVVDAVTCAVAIQSAMAEADSPIRLRIGINLGDVIVDGDDIYGDGVNIAARLEALAESGGICISSIVHESLGNRVDAAFTDAGEHEVKNITRPIRVFRWPANEAQDAARLTLIPDEARQDHTIAVARFENLSNDEELGFFCEGVTQDIITAFGTVEQLTVVADEHRVAEDKAHFVLSGKVRKGGNRLRVSAQLVDRDTGVQRWAERYDRAAEDLFQVQDDVTRNIVIAVHAELGSGSYHNRWQWGTENFEAWQLMAKGFHEFQKFSPESLAKTAALWEQAMGVDPDYLAPLMGCGYCWGHLAFLADGDEKAALIAKAESTFERSVAEAPDDVRPYAAKRSLETARGDHAAAVAAARTAHTMAPNDSYTRAALGMALTAAASPEEALAHLTKAFQEMPAPPGWAVMAQIHCHFMLGDLEEARRLSRHMVARLPEAYSGQAMTAALAAALGDAEEAATMRAATLDMDPQFSVNTFVRWQGLKDRDYGRRLLDALAAAGLPA
jgi:adenylate cyclase